MSHLFKIHDYGLFEYTVVLSGGELLQSEKCCKSEIAKRVEISCGCFKEQTLTISVEVSALPPTHRYHGSVRPWSTRSMEPGIGEELRQKQ